MVKANRRILSVQSTLETTRKEAKILKTDYDTEVTRFQRDKSDLQSTLEAIRKEAEALKAGYDTEVIRLQRDKSDLQSALDALQMEVTEGKQRLSLGIGDFRQWMRDSSVNADTLISDFDPSNSSSDIHQVLAHNALLRVRWQIWSWAYEDANKVIFHALIRVLILTSTHPHVKSIVIRPSAMGYIAKALAQIGKGEPKKAVRTFDLAFGNCNPNESNLLLLVKVCDS